MHVPMQISVKQHLRPAGHDELLRERLKRDLLSEINFVGVKKVLRDGSSPTQALVWESVPVLQSAKNASVASSNCRTDLIGSNSLGATALRSWRLSGRRSHAVFQAAKVLNVDGTNGTRLARFAPFVDAAFTCWRIAGAVRVVCC